MLSWEKQDPYENTPASPCSVSLLCWVDFKLKGEAPSPYSCNLDSISTSTAWWHCVGPVKDGEERVRVPGNNEVETHKIVLVAPG